MLARSSPKRRRGQIAFVTVFAMMALLILCSALVNTNRMVGAKLETQNAADASAHAAGVEMARGMNTLTALQHLIAELNALDALVMSFGGIPLEEGHGIALNNSRVASAYAEAAVWNGGRNPVGRSIARTSHSKSGAAIGSARKRLQQVLEWAYRVHAAGGVMVMEPVLSSFRSFGRLLVLAAYQIERNVAFEWRVLAYLEQLAEGPLLGLKHLCNPLIIPQLYRHAKETVEETPRRAEAAAAAVAEQHAAEGTLFPNTLGRGPKLALPVVPEVIRRHTVTHRHSQMVRGMTPWVQYWRKPILDFGRAVLPLSRFARFYHTESNEFTLNMAWWQWVENKTHLYVLTDLEVAGADKGEEPWTTKAGSRRADELFAVMGFAHRPAPYVVAYPLLRDSQPDGVAAHAQVLLYNANPQDRPRRAKWQPVVGWDTLAWDGPVPEFEFGERYGSDRDIREQPRIKLNWQTKLVPTTRLKDAAGTQPSAELNRILDRTAADTWIANTH